MLIKIANLIKQKDHMFMLAIFFQMFLQMVAPCTTGVSGIKNLQSRLTTVSYDCQHYPFHKKYPILSSLVRQRKLHQNITLWLLPALSLSSKISYLLCCFE